MVERLIISCDIKGGYPAGAIVGASYSNQLQIEGCNVVGNITSSATPTGGLVCYCSSDKALPNGATEKTESEMNEIMDIQSFCDLMNNYGKETCTK